MDLIRFLVKERNPRASEKGPALLFIIQYQQLF